MCSCSVKRTLGTAAIAALLWSGFPATGQAQSRKEVKKLLREANADYDEGSYGTAWPLYRRVLTADPTQSKAASRAGYSAVTLNYPVDSLKKINGSLQTSKEADALYYLAIVGHHDKKISEALNHLKEYEKLPQGRRMFSNKDIGRLTGWCQSAEKMLKSPGTAVIRNMGPAVNSAYGDYVPVIMPDESALYFTSRRETASHPLRNGDGTFFEDVYVSRRQQNKWTQAENIGIPVNSETNDACVAISPDGQRMIVYRTSENIATGDLYITSIGNDGKWQALQKMNEKINSPHIETSACFSNDTAEIYFSSDRPGGLGGKDLYRIRKLPNGQWSEAMNLGSNVNTATDDDAPFMHPDGVTLYFSSKGHNSMGDFDVFKTTWSRDSNSFSPAENLGYPINDVGADIFFVLSVDGQRGYYTTSRTDDMGGTDLYEIDTRFSPTDLMVRTGHIILGNGYGRGRITVTEKQSGELNGSYSSHPESGRFILALSPHKTYEAVVGAEGFKEQRLTLTPQAFEDPKGLTIILVRDSAP